MRWLSSYRELKGMSIARVADRLRRLPATIKAYLFDPTDEKVRALVGLLTTGRGRTRVEAGERRWSV